MVGVGVTLAVGVEDGVGVWVFVGDGVSLGKGVGDSVGVRVGWSTAGAISNSEGVASAESKGAVCAS
jgi:hypothetical protein